MTASAVTISSSFLYYRDYGALESMDAIPVLKPLYAKYVAEFKNPPPNASKFKAFCQGNGVSLPYNLYTQFLRDHAMTNAKLDASPPSNNQKIQTKPIQKKKRGKSSKRQQHYFTAQQLAALCREVIIPKLKTTDPNSHDMLNQKKYQQLIESVLCEHGIDSFQVNRIAATTFAARMQERASTKKIKFAASTMWKILQKEVKAMGGAVQWKHIINAVRHELNNQIADKVADVVPSLGPLEKTSEEAVTFAINSSTDRTLTEAEAKYLRFLIARATNNIPLTVPKDQSLVGVLSKLELFHFQWVVHFQLSNGH